MTHPDGVAHGPDGAPPPGSALSNSEQTTGTADSSGSSRSVGAAGHVGGGRRSALNGDRFLLVATGAGLCVAAACSLIIAKLLADVNSADGAVRRDPQILTWAVDHRTAALTTLFRAVTHLADPLVVILVAAVAAQLLFRARHRTLALLVVATTAGTAVTTTVMKAAVDRARPPQTLWLSFASGPAFPSGHSAQSVALYGSIAVADHVRCAPACPPGGCAAGGRSTRRRRREFAGLPRRSLADRCSVRLGGRDSLAHHPSPVRMVVAAPTGGPAC